MKTTFTRFLKNGLLATALLVSSWASAATYTAISSGAWSNASIWAGGTAPGSSLGLLDNVIINAGVTVTLDMDVEFNSLLTSLEVNGTLESSSSSNYLLDMNSGSLTGNGSLMLHNLRFGTTGSMSFSGESSIDNFWNSSAALNLAADLELNDSLFLDEGSFNLVSGGTLTLMSGAVIQVDNGSMTAASGVLNNSNDYSVVYVGEDKTTGLELAGSGLTAVWVELDDNDQVLSIGGDVTLEGMVHHNHGMIDLDGHSLTLKDDYMAMSGAMFMGSATSNLSIQTSASLTSNLMFDADNNELNNLMLNTSGSSSNVNLGSNLTIMGSLMLQDGDFTMTSGTLTMGSGSEIMISGGHMLNAGGTFNGTNSYGVTYNGSASTMSGMELSGSGLSDLTIDLENEADSVELMTTLNLNGELNLENGGMAMNGYDLTLGGSLSTTANGWLAGDEESDMTFNTTSLLNDTLWFHSTNHTFGDITINSTDESSLMIGNDLRVENINMTSGGVHMWDSELWITSTGMINGADEDRYVMIDGSGSLVMNVQVSAPYTMFPIGTDGGYAPVSIQQTTGTAGYFKANTINGVWSQGLLGINFATDQNVVNRTWNISAVNSSSLNYNIRTMWTEGMELFDFDRNEAYLMNYTSDAWDELTQIAGPATASGNMYYMEREGMTTSGPFAVRNAAAVGIDENALANGNVYPNPVRNLLNCTVTLDGATTVSVMDIAGNVLHTENVEGTGTVNHQVDFSAYPEGVYFVNHTNAKGTNAYRVVKSL